MAAPGLATFDVVVWGAGPAGAAAARMLALSGHHVALLEFDSCRRPAGESLPAAARPLLHRLGVWGRFEAGPHLPCYGGESAWGSDRIHRTDSLRDPHGHGWLLDRAAFDVSLRAAAQAAGAVLFSASVPAQVCPREAGLWRLGFRDGAGQTRSLAAPWLIDGTGRRSRLARLLGVRRVRLDGLVGHAALFRADAAPPGADVALTTLVEAGPEGWWYTAPTPDGARVVVYLTDADTPTGRRARAREGLLSLLSGTRHVRERLRACGMAPADGPWVACAHTARLERCSGDGWLAVGDAALSFDPLSSQGLFHALASGLDAAQAVADALAGRTSATADYERSRSAVFEAYQRHRAVFYAQERRWPGGAFWERRHQSTKPIQD